MTAAARPYVIPKAPRHLPDARHEGTNHQPVSSVEWVDRDTLNPNDWNPNRHASPEMILLAVSILEDGWTQPIVARKDGTIVDGFHRWAVSAWPPVKAATGGVVPVVYLNDADPAGERLATVRHNRARGSHYVLSMADLVAELVGDLGVDPKDLEARLGMEAEEVTRLLDRGDMRKRGAAAEFNKGWVPEKHQNALS